MDASEQDFAVSDLKFTEALSELFAGKEMGEDARRVLEAHTALQCGVRGEMPSFGLPPRGFDAFFVALETDVNQARGNLRLTAFPSTG